MFSVGAMLNANRAFAPINAIRHSAVGRRVAWQGMTGAVGGYIGAGDGAANDQSWRGLGSFLFGGIGGYMGGRSETRLGGAITGGILQAGMGALGSRYGSTHRGSYNHKAAVRARAARRGHIV